MASAQKGCVTRLQKEYKSLLRVSDASYNSSSSSTSSCVAQDACNLQQLPSWTKSMSALKCSCVMKCLLLPAAAVATHCRIAQQPVLRLIYMH
jgi:hypothetical protein